MAIFGVGFFRSIQRFNGDNNGSGVLVLRGTCTKIFQLSSTRSGLLQYGSGDSGTLAVAVVVWWFKDLDAIFIMFELFCASSELL